MKVLVAIVVSALALTLNLRAQNVFISEFMPSNERILADENGQFPDWIEIQNGGNAAVNLQGWFLTDSASALKKWVFPSVTLQPNGFLVVFASGKNRTNDTTHLHTSFQLNTDGGFLALVRPDGTNIASAFAGYPNIKEDVSFGIAQKLTTTALLANSVPQILVPTSAASLAANWNQLAYAPDSAWTNGAVPPAVGFDTNQIGGTPVNVAPGGTAVQSTTYNGSTYPASLAINNILTDFSHTATTDSSAFWQVTLTNEMAIYDIVLFNRGGGCCQWRLRDITIEIVSTNVSGSVTNWSSPLLNPENVLNGPASLSNNLVAITGGPVLGRTIRIHRKADPDNSGAGTGTTADDQNVLALGEVVIGASVSGGLKPYLSTDIQSLMFGRNASAFVRLPFVSSTAPDTLTLNVRYDDGFVAYLNGTEVARRNAPAALAFNSSATVDRALTNATVSEAINLSANIPLLVSGTNVLAVQVLNFGPANGDALFQPQLIATRMQTTTNVFLSDATPGVLNDSAFYYDEVADTHFSVDRGFFEAPFSLSITSATPGAVIYYSFNADEPAPGKGVLYTGPITITNTTVLRTRAFKDNWKSTDVDTATYIFLADVIRQVPNWPNDRIPPQYFPATWGANAVDYGMDPEVVNNYTLAQWKEALTQVPTMSIVTEMRNLFDATTGIYANAAQHGEVWERPMSLELLDPTNAVPGRFQENCGLRIRGGFSRNTSFFKHSFRVFFRREYGAGKLDYPLFENDGAQEFETFDLRTSQNYSWPRGSESPGFETMVREVFCRETLGAMGQPYRRSRYYHLYVNGQYWGLYETDERPEASYGQTYFGGSKENFDVVKCGNRGTNPNFATEPTDGNLVAWSNLWVMCQVMRTNASASNYFRPLGCNPDGTRNPNLPVMIDVDNLIDYMLEIFFSGDGDATLSAFLANNMPNNWFGMRDRTNQDVGFRFFNSDCEHTLGSPSSQVNRTGPFPNSNEGNFTFSNPQWMHEELSRNIEYRIRFADHVQRHFFNGGVLTLQSCTNRFLRKAGQINKAMRAYSARWGDAVRTTPPYGESDWTNAIQFVLNWFPPRANIVLGQLRAFSYGSLFPGVSAPDFSQLGGAVPAGYSLVMAHTNSSGAIYFTSDGTDPRVVGGAVSSSAQAYSSPLAINATTLIRARVLTGTNWSPALEYTFYPPQDLSKLLITEIMYHPPAAGLVDGDDFEFLELKNAGTNSVNLGGLSFSGISFTFANGTVLAPGQFFVLARNAAAFTNKYPSVMVNGIYTGGLNNGGEAIELLHPLGSKVLSVNYSDFTPWPLTADGYGFSLVPKNANSNPDPDDAANWRASTTLGGSPGRDDPASAVSPVLINEVLSHSETGVDFIELFNPNASAVNIGGWFLTDDPDVPQKFRIPNNTTIAPLGYLVFTETNFNATPGTNNSFSLNARGDDVYLFSGDANTNLTGYSHGFSFGASPDGATFGRYVISTGEEQFPGQLTPTPNQPNSGPRIGPVVINEVMYHPDIGGDEFIELRNITTNAVPLYDPLRATNTWRLSGLNFDFPSNVTLGANQMLLLVATNPAVFRTKYSIAATVQILGPYAGSLQDSGERLELQRPDVPDTNGLAYITVDEVRYNDKAPWPAAADGSGPSLQRKLSSAYGNDPANWEAATPTPGADFLGGQSPSIAVQPQSQIGLIGQDVSFSVVANGPAPLNYKWRFNGGDIPGATSSALVLTNLQAWQAGDYSVIVFNNGGSAASAIAQLTLKQPPIISAQPTNIFVRPGSNAVFSVTASVNGFASYQWRFNGTNIAGATNATLVITNSQFVNEGAYSAVVTDTVGPTTSAAAKLTILVDPVIIQQPISQNVIAGGNVTISVTVTNTATLPVGYRLRRNAATLPETFVTLNQRSGFFTITNLQPQFTNYSIVVSNIARIGGIASANAILTFVIDTDGDGIPDDWETAFGLGTNNIADAALDSDGDKMSNWQEYIAGTDPTNPQSYLKMENISVGEGATLTFGAVSNKTYTIQFSGSVSGPWSRLVDLVARATNRTEVIVDSTAPTNRFYRAVTPQQQ